VKHGWRPEFYLEKCVNHGRRLEFYLEKCVQQEYPGREQEDELIPWYQK
jgi:hypothetical protein